jgi:predicted dehydrogenase
MAPPPSLDYDRWLGPAPWRPYHPSHVHFSFRYFLDYSTGSYADFWCHISDIAFWALDPGAPLTIAARGERHPNSVADAPVWIDVDLEFPGLHYYWTTRPPDVRGAEGMHIGCYFEGQDGWLLCDYGNRTVCVAGEQPAHDLPHVPKTVPRSPGHHRNFLDAVRSRALAESNLDYVMPMTVPMFFGRISFLLQRSLRWDAEREEFVGDEEATRLLGRAYRAPWIMPQAS